MEAQTGPGVGQVVGVGLGADIPELAVVGPLHIPHQVHHGLQAVLVEGDVLDDGQAGPPEVLQSNSQSVEDEDDGAWAGLT